MHLVLLGRGEGRTDDTSSNKAVFPSHPSFTPLLLHQPSYYYHPIHPHHTHYYHPNNTNEWNFTSSSSFSSELKIHWVDTLAKAKAACHFISTYSRVIAFDLEGVNLGRNGVVSLIQIAVDENTVYCFDVLQLGKTVFDFEMLGSIFASRHILKLCFDCRVDGDVLQSIFQVQLNVLYDIQILYTCLFQNRTDRFLKGLHHALRMPNVIPDKQVLKTVLATKHKVKGLLSLMESSPFKPEEQSQTNTTTPAASDDATSHANDKRRYHHYYYPYHHHYNKKRKNHYSTRTSNSTCSTPTTRMMNENPRKKEEASSSSPTTSTTSPSDQKKEEEVTEPLLLKGTSTATNEDTKTKKSEDDPQQHIFLKRPIPFDILKYCCCDVVYLLRMYKIWAGHRPIDFIVHMSMRRLDYFIHSQKQPVPPQQMSLLDFYIM